jgi:hypothetical protein
MPEVARTYEGNGFESLWTPEHLVFPAEMPARYPYTDSGYPVVTPDTPTYNPWVVLAYVILAVYAEDDVVEGWSRISHPSGLAAGYGRCRGTRAKPRTVLVCTHSNMDSSTRQVGKRASVACRAILPSRRASAAPTQKWAP